MGRHSSLVPASLGIGLDEWDKHDSMTMTAQAVSMKSLAFRVLREMAAQKRAQESCPTPAEHVGQSEGQAVKRSEAPACGSPHCAGCYEVSYARKIHPPRCGEGYRAWLERWEAKGKVQ